MQDMTQQPVTLPAQSLPVVCEPDGEFVSRARCGVCQGAIQPLFDILVPYCPRCHRADVAGVMAYVAALQRFHQAFPQALLASGNLYEMMPTSEYIALIGSADRVWEVVIESETFQYLILIGLTGNSFKAPHLYQECAVGNNSCSNPWIQLSNISASAEAACVCDQHQTKEQP